MKTWEEMIEIRRLKEAVGVSDFELKISLFNYQQALSLALSQLSGLERIAVGLRFLGGLPIARIADVLGLSWDETDELIDDGGIDHVRAQLKGSPFEFKQERNEVLHEAHQAAI